MRAVLQRVLSGSVTVDREIVGQIGPGLVILLGIGQEDGQADIKYLAEKIVNLRIFEDDEGKMNLSALGLGMELLVISQFTLYGDCRKGRRPSFSEGASPKDAEVLYNEFLGEINKYGLRVETGKFQAMMDVEMVNTGPVTMLIDSKRNF
ncbi:MAG: D-tyrosyl-tRNA(Tyr) deacylase [Halanaerobiales bacterium]|nr:D-tyrosyl-tRNA(Tyr) deacylase [Halanaerobiales bacterium]